MASRNHRRLRFEQMEERRVLAAGSLASALPSIAWGDSVETSDVSGSVAQQHSPSDCQRSASQCLSAPLGPPATPLPQLLVEDRREASDQVFALPLQVEFSGADDGHIEAQHSPGLELSEGTISLRFVADQVEGQSALFSKDRMDGDQEGDLTAFVRDGAVAVRLQSGESEAWLSTEPGSIEARREYQLSLTFGNDGFWLYLNGEMRAWKTYVTQGLADNRHEVLLGATGWSRDAENPDRAYFPFDGTLIEMSIYDSQFDHRQIAEAAGLTAPTYLAPTVVDGVLHGSDEDDALLARGKGVHQIDGGYGDDLLVGTAGDDVLNGGYGEDRLEGGSGNDLLISRSDGGEAIVAQDFGPERDANGEIDPLTRTFYANQPIEADDVLIGGDGADTFRFEVLMNAKPEKLVRRSMDNGMIHWHGIAQENDYVHDHWVERLGREVIWDFDRASGDKIEIIGHTVAAHELEHVDVDGDGVLDASVLNIYSQQGPRGAHDRDWLGSITVFGDLLQQSDYAIDRDPAFGVIEHLRDIHKAMAPRRGDPIWDGDALPPTPALNNPELPPGAVFGLPGTTEFSGAGGDFIEAPHYQELEVDSGAILLRFTADRVDGQYALFSKDYTGNRDGGDLTAFVRDGSIGVRLQTAEGERWLSTPPGSIAPGREYQVAISFGQPGFGLYLDGALQARDVELKQGLAENRQNFLIGSTGWSRDAQNPHRAHFPFAGSITDLLIYDLQAFLEPSNEATEGPTAGVSSRERASRSDFAVSNRSMIELFDIRQ